MRYLRCIHVEQNTRYPLQHNIITSSFPYLHLPADLCATGAPQSLLAIYPLDLGNMIQDFGYGYLDRHRKLLDFESKRVGRSLSHVGLDRSRTEVQPLSLNLVHDRLPPGGGDDGDGDGIELTRPAGLRDLDSPVVV